MGIYSICLSCNNRGNIFYSQLTTSGYTNIKTSYSFNENTGPRHMAFHPSKQYVYVISETSHEVFTFNINSDYTLALEASHQIIGSNGLTGAEISTVNYNNKDYLFYSMRSSTENSENKIYCADITEGNSVYKGNNLWSIKSGGVMPRYFTHYFDKGNSYNYLLITNQSSYNDSQTGNLTIYNLMRSISSEPDTSNPTVLSLKDYTPTCVAVIN